MLIIDTIPKTGFRNLKGRPPFNSPLLDADVLDMLSPTKPKKRMGKCTSKMINN